MSRTSAWSAWTRSDPIRVSYGEPIGNEPTGKDHPELLKLHPSHGHDQTIINGISRIGYMSGGKAARWVDEDMADTFTREGRRVHRTEPGQAVLPLFRHPRSACAPRAASALCRQERLRRARRCDRAVRLVRRAKSSTRSTG